MMDSIFVIPHHLASTGTAMPGNRFFRSMTVLLLTVFGTCLLQSTVAAQGADPAINRPYQNADYDRWVSLFERPGREVYDRREAIVEAVRPKQGMVIADIGAGTGLFTRLFATRVGQQGRVIAVDISAEFIDNILRTSRQQGLDNVRGLVGGQRSTGLPPLAIDLAFICDTYHHFEHPQAMLTSIRQALRPGGELVIIDFKLSPGSSGAWVEGHVRADRESVIGEVEQAGFRLTEAPDLLHDNYFLRFVKLP